MSKKYRGKEKKNDFELDDDFEYSFLDGFNNNDDDEYDEDEFEKDKYKKNETYHYSEEDFFEDYEYDEDLDSIFDRRKKKKEAKQKQKNKKKSYKHRDDEVNNPTLIDKDKDYKAVNEEFKKENNNQKNKNTIKKNKGSKYKNIDETEVVNKKDSFLKDFDDFEIIDLNDLPDVPKKTSFPKEEEQTIEVKNKLPEVKDDNSVSYKEVSPIDDIEYNIDDDYLLKEKEDIIKKKKNAEKENKVPLKDKLKNIFTLDNLEDFYENNRKFIIFIGVIFAVFISILIFSKFTKRVSEQWLTDRITISTVDGAEFDVTDKGIVSRISKYCDEGVFTKVKDNQKLGGNCEIWINFNNGTIVGMYQNKDYGYVGDSKQYVGDPTYLPSGLNQFIKNIISENVESYHISGEIYDIKNLSYYIKLSGKIVDEIGTDKMFVCVDNMAFNDIKNYDFNIGDTIQVTYNGTIIDSFPPQVNATKIILVKVKEEEKDKKLEEMNEILKSDNEYESKLQSLQQEENERFGQTNTQGDFIYEVIKPMDDAITISKIPAWVEQENNITKLYSFGTIDYLIDTLAESKFERLTNGSWSDAQRSQMYLGQGIKCFNKDSEASIYYYPVFLNGNIVSLMKMEEVSSGEYDASLVLDLCNLLNNSKIRNMTSTENPFILVKKDNILLALIGNTMYSEQDVSSNIKMSEISGIPVVNVLEKLTAEDILTNYEGVTRTENDTNNINSNTENDLQNDNNTENTENTENTTNVTEDSNRVQASIDCDVFAEPDMDSTKYGKLEAGTEVEKIEKMASGWTKIKYKGQNAYVLTQNLTNIQ